MALFTNNAHTIYYHMDALDPVSLAQDSFSYPDYSVVQCKVYSAVLFSDTVSP